MKEYDKMFVDVILTLRVPNIKTYVFVQVPEPKKRLILGVGLTHLVESRYLFFLKAEIVDNIFQWDALKNTPQIKSYDDMFQAIRALTVQNILKIRISSQKFLESESFSSFSPKCFDLNPFRPGFFTV